MSAPVYRPKRLVWEKVNPAFYRANTMIGQVTIDCVLGRWVTSVDGKKFGRLSLAQAAAQAWYDARMIEGLEEVKL